jgi:capsular polysaccharide biosynthesis protein
LKGVYTVTAKGDLKAFFAIIYGILIYRVRILFFYLRQYFRIRSIKRRRMAEISPLLSSTESAQILDGLRSLYILNPKEFQDSPELRERYLRSLSPMENSTELEILKRRLNPTSIKATPTVSADLARLISQPLRQVSLKSFIAEHNFSEHIFKQAQTIDVNVAPRIGEDSATLLGKLNVPESSMSVCNDIYVIPNFCLISRDGEFVIHEPAAEFKSHLVAGLWHLFHRDLSDSNDLRYQGRITREVSCDEAILFGGRNSTNYFHWSIEYLAKLLEVSLAEVSINVPLIVSDEMPIQHYQMLDKINRDHRPVLFVDSSTAIRIKKLWVPSTHTFTPDDFTSDHWRTSALSADHLSFLKTHVDSPFKFPHKVVYLARLQHMRRNIVNEAALIRSLKKAGTQVILPELLTADQQISLFRDADVIIASCGAALANSVFRRPNSVLHMIISEGIENFTLYSNMQFMAGGHCFRIIGKPTRNRAKFRSDEDYAHSNFSIPQETIEKLNTWLKTHIGTSIKH